MFRYRIFVSFWVATSIFAVPAYAISDRTVESLASTDEGRPTVVIMRPDIEVHLLTAGGIPELHEEWTLAARSNFVSEVGNFAEGREVDIVVMDVDQELTDEELAYDKLHWAVGQTIANTHLMGTKLKTKNSEMDWTLGPGVSVIGDNYDADYALFTFYRDYQATGGRIAMAMLTAVATGVATGGATAVMPGTGGESGFATLVDLKTGDIVWANYLQIGAGDLREEKGAKSAVKKMFANLPD